MCRRTRLVACLSLAGALFIASGAWAQIELQPGLWQETETGSENNQPPKVETTMRCMTAEEAKQPSKAMVFDEELRKHCKALAFERTGDKLTFRLQCGAESLEVTMDAVFTIDTPQHYAGSIKASLSLGPIALSLNKTIDAKRIGECPDNK